MADTTTPLAAASDHPQLLHDAPSERPPTERRVDHVDLSLEEAERAFLTWLDDPGNPDVARLPDGTLVPVGRVLGAASTSTRELPRYGALSLGLTPGISLGDAATELLVCVVDPAGPRCRSYRAAVLYLRGLVDLSSAWKEL